MKNKLRSISLLLIIVVFSLCASGCMTSYLIKDINQDTGDVINTEWNKINDTIVAIGQPDKALLKKLGHPKTIAFLGLKHTYFIFEGGEALVEISKVLNPNFIDITTDAKMSKDHENIDGTISISYFHPDGTQPGNEEISLLEKLQFKITDNYYNSIGYKRSITFKGVVGPKVDIPENQTKLLKRKRLVTFVAPKTTFSISNLGVKVLQVVAVLPLGVAVDAFLVAGLPVMIIGSH